MCEISSKGQRSRQDFKIPGCLLSKEALGWGNLGLD